MSSTSGNSLHFSHVAPVYAQVRDTDPEAVRAIIDFLPRDRLAFDVADVGCGTGRYSELVLSHLRSAGNFYCCDYSPAMLTECRRRMRKEMDRRKVHFSRGSAAALPLGNESLDAIVTFNAVHHFDLLRFISEAQRVLRPGGILAIYTRTPMQNSRTVWGLHFPHFNEYENRLFTLAQLQDAICRATALHLDEVREMVFPRRDTPETLIARAESHHYSTFALYPRDEFRKAITVFGERLRGMVNGKKFIDHKAHNTLVIARRGSNGLYGYDVAP